MKVLVAGPGAVGCYYGGKLQQAGAEVSLICRSDFDQVKQHGVSIESTTGDFTFIPHRVVRSADEYCDELGVPDIVLVSLKVLPSIDVPQIIRPAVGSDTTIVMVQNGVEIEAAVADAFPGRELISALAFVCINRIAPGRLRHMDYGRIVMGDYPSGAGNTAAELVRMYNSVDVSAKVSDDIVRDRWYKLVWNAAFNPMSVVWGGVTTRDIMDSPDSADVAAEVMKEVVAVAESKGLTLPDDTVAKYLRETSEMSPYRTSMLMDHEQGRELEVDAILGRAVKIARNNGIKVPHLETLYSALSMINTRQ